MSKTIATQIEKATTLVVGLRKYAAIVEEKGIKAETVNQIEAYCKELQVYDLELDKLREEVHARVQITNEKLAQMKDEMQRIRMIIRNNYPQEEWINYGVLDKK